MFFLHFLFLKKGKILQLIANLSCSLLRVRVTQLVSWEYWRLNSAKTVTPISAQGGRRPHGGGEEPEEELGELLIVAVNSSCVVSHRLVKLATGLLGQWRAVACWADGRSYYIRRGYDGTRSIPQSCCWEQEPLTSSSRRRKEIFWPWKTQKE